MKLWPILASVFGPGVAQALVGRRRTAIAFAVLFALGVLALGFTIYGIAAAGVVWIVSILDTVVHVARTPAVARDRTHEAALCWALLVAIGFVSKLFVAEAFKFPTSSMLPTIDLQDHVFVSKLGTYGRGDIVVFVHPCMPRDYGKRIVAVEHDTVEIRCGRLHVNGAPVPETLVAAKTTYHDTDGAAREASRYTQRLGGKTFDIFDARPDRTEPDPSKDFPLDRLMSCATQRDFESQPNAKQLPGEIVDTKADAGPCEPQRHYVVPPGHVFVLGDNRSNSNDSRFWGSVPVDHIKGRAIGIWLPVRHFGSL